jgi:hypothetical protein
MKNLLKKLVEVAYGAKVHATHTAIKGRKSGGQRDNNNIDFRVKYSSDQN